jgi:hypothetical protein
LSKLAKKTIRAYEETSYDVAIGGDQETGRTGFRIVSPGCGLIQQTMLLLVIGFLISDQP